MNIIQKEHIMLFARENFADKTHAEGHISRVLSLTKKIAAAYADVQYEALMTACVLHDCARREQMENSGIAHAKAGAVKAETFLLKEGFDAAFCRRVSEIIAAHSNKEDAEKGGIEEKILYDADKLDMVGAVGFIRTVAYAVSADEPLDGEAQCTLLHDLEFDLAFVERDLFTDTAAKIAEERLNFSRNALRLLKKQLANETDAMDSFIL